MRFNDHSELAGRHAFLGASKYHWINYSEEKLDRTYKAHLATLRGSQLHEFAMQAIRLGIRLPRTPKTLNDYVNDAIGFRMTPEQVLYYSDNAFGTADAISFRKNVLRIHELKTGAIPASFHQLEIYAAFFCLEYNVKPSTIDMELRIYQNDQIQVLEPEVDQIAHIMDRIVTFDARINALRMEKLA